MHQRTVFIVAFLVSLLFAQAQRLDPGFNKEEYTALMKVSAQFGDSTYSAEIPPPEGYHFIYRSPVMGLDNRWDLWQTDKGIPVISIRGTTTKEISWLANFYAAMTPAKGELRLSDSTTFNYELADNPRAAVHTGWLIGTGFLSKDILSKIDSCYKSGNKNFFIIGHSQGGAIAYLLTAYLGHLQKQKLLPADIQFKTYCSAAPKPGNIYFAYEYEAMTREGWGYNVINAADWVPQTPFSVQTLGDFTTINPFVNVDAIVKKQSLPKRLLLRIAYGKLTKPAKKTLKNYKKFLGSYVSRSVKKALPGFVPPVYANTSDYVRTGYTITLIPNQEYLQKYPQEASKVFVNHLHGQYLYLMQWFK